ncbi:MAG: T9SS type A sorting domain-containing protein [Bacteroidetes bacterium]|nr:T9SS type A sorting domain-containing protein [Bacteroidota bacterium]
MLKNIITPLILLLFFIFLRSESNAESFFKAGKFVTSDTVLNPEVKVFRNVSVYEYFSSNSLSSLDLYDGQTLLANVAIRDAELADSTGIGRDRFFLRSGDGNQDFFPQGQETKFVPFFNTRGTAYSQVNFDTITRIETGHPDPIFPSNDFYKWSTYSLGRNFVQSDIRCYGFWLKGKKVNYGLTYECFGIMYLKSIETVVIGGISTYKLTVDIKINIRAKNDFREYIVGIKNMNSNVPTGYSLSQNYPNPFNPFTKIKFEIPKSSFVKITIYNSLGEAVQINNEQLSAGVYDYSWDASRFSSGLYFYKLEANNFTQIRKMMLVK